MSMRCGSLLLMLSCRSSWAACRPGTRGAALHAGPGDAGVFMKPKPADSRQESRQEASVRNIATAERAAATSAAAAAGRRNPPPAQRPATAIDRRQGDAREGRQEEAPRRRAAGPQAGRHDHRASLPRRPARAGIPAGERLKIQSALLWAGDYAGVGKDDDPLRGAVKNFQKRHKAKVTGVLTVKQRADLARRRRPLRAPLRLARGDRSGDRHPHRPADQAGAERP